MPIGWWRRPGSCCAALAILATVITVVVIAGVAVRQHLADHTPLVPIVQLLELRAVGVQTGFSNFPTMPAGPIAKEGEWVTNLNGTRACRLIRDIDPQERSAFQSSFYWRTVCSNWQQRVPQSAMPLPDWLRLDDHPEKNSVHVEDGWR